MPFTDCSTDVPTVLNTPKHDLVSEAKNNVCLAVEKLQINFTARTTYSLHSSQHTDTERLESTRSQISRRIIHTNAANEHLNSPRWHIDLEPWASESRSLEDEARRFLDYITTPQPIGTNSLNTNRDSDPEGPKGPWAVCMDPKYSLTHRIHSKNCRVYSLGLGMDDRSLERSLAKSGCEVHCFDPSLKQPHLQQAEMWLHRLSVDWRDPNPAIVAQHQHASTKKLATILNDFGHRQVDVLKADMESAEWKILENLILEGVLDSVGQLLLELHLHWAGFEVGGDDPSVVRYWFSLLKELEHANFRLFRFHSDPAKPRLFLHKNVLNASSAYTLGWINTQWRPK
uniref:Methyltransferase like 24 n=1 Tax=Myripristis murdjan TaxID=586833 RepID=A0A667ZJZ2_9TELE